jgi:lysophospholipase L1-like esterase
MAQLAEDNRVAVTDRTDRARPRAELSRGRRVVFALLMIAGLLGILEALGAAYYYLVLPEQRREVAELALGLRVGGQSHVSRYRPHPYFNHVANPDFARADGEHPYDPIGIRATSVPLTERRPGTLRVVAMGASTTYGYYAEDAKDTWPAMLGTALEEDLGVEVEVINAGVPYFTTYEMLGFASMWLPEMKPDLVLLHVGLNDAFAVGYPDEGGPDNTTFRHAWDLRPVPPLARRAMRVSYLARSLGLQWLRRNGYQVGDMSAAIQYRIPDDAEMRANASKATGRYFRRNVETLLTLIRHTDATPVLVDMPLNPERESGLGAYYDAVSEAVRRNNRILAEIGAEQSVPVIDLYSRMRDPRAYVDAAHCTRAGQQQKSWLIHQALDVAALDLPVERR